MRPIALHSLGFALLAAQSASAGELPLPDQHVAAIAREVDGALAKQTLEGIVQQHRERGSRGYRRSAEWVASRARSYGLADVEILRFAQAHGADLIVMGTHGYGAVKRLFLGSVADRVVRGATCPVLVVPARAVTRHEDAAGTAAHRVGAI